MPADADITKYESQMLRALHSRICPQVFAIRAIALLAHTWGAPNVYACSCASASQAYPLGLLS